MFARVGKGNKVNLVFPEEKNCIFNLVYARGYLSFVSILDNAGFSMGS
jgi:hypothetical protein